MRSELGEWSITPQPSHNHHGLNLTYVLSGIQCFCKQCEHTSLFLLSTSFSREFSNGRTVKIHTTEPQLPHQLFYCLISLDWDQRCTQKSDCQIKGARNAIQLWKPMAGQVSHYLIKLFGSLTSSKDYWEKAISEKLEKIFYLLMIINPQCPVDLVAVIIPLIN